MHALLSPVVVVGQGVVVLFLLETSQEAPVSLCPNAFASTLSGILFARKQTRASEAPLSGSVRERWREKPFSRIIWTGACALASRSRCYERTLPSTHVLTHFLVHTAPFPSMLVLCTATGKHGFGHGLLLSLTGG